MKNSKLTLSCPVDLQAADSESGKLPTFEMVAYTGVPMNAGGFYTPVIVELSGVKAGPNVAIFLDHDPSRIIGQGKATVEADRITVSGAVMGEDADAQKVLSLSKNGFKWQASIGAAVVRREFLEAGKKARVNGRDVVGPLMIARESRLNEVSFVALGADSQTSAAVAASMSRDEESAMEFEKWLQASGWDPEALSDAQKSKLKASFDLEQKGPAAPAASAATVQAGTYSGLDEIFQKSKAETARRNEITRIAAESLREYPVLADDIEAAAKKAIDDQIAPSEFELSLLRACRPQMGLVGRRRREEAVSDRVVEAAICQSAKLKDVEKFYDERTLEAAHKKWRGGLGVQELLITAARERGCDSLSVASGLESVLRAAFNRDIRAAGGFSTLDVSSILSNVANKFVIEAFNNVENSWRAISSIRPVSDFKQITAHSLTGDLQYEKVGPGGEIKHGTLGEEVYTNKAETFAKMLAITRQDIINDDLGAFAAVPRRLGRGGALAINNEFWTQFLDNSTFFTTGRGNFDDGAADTLMDLTGLTNADTLFRTQTDPDGKPLGATPRILLVPTALRVKAMNLMNSTEIRTSEALSSGGAQFPVGNAFAGAFRVVESQYLQSSAYTGYSAKAWYLLADPQDIPVIETVFLGGREMPVVETADADFDRLGVKMRAYHDFGVSKQEYRGGVKMKGES